MNRHLQAIRIFARDHNVTCFSNNGAFPYFAGKRKGRLMCCNCLSNNSFQDTRKSFSMCMNRHFSGFPFPLIISASIQFEFDNSYRKSLLTTNKLFSSVTLKCYGDKTQLKEMTGEFEFMQEEEDNHRDLEQNSNMIIRLDSNADIIMKESIENCGNASSNRENKIKYPLKGMGLAEPVFTERYESSKGFLKSLNIPTDELQFYPDIQKMETEDIMSCIARLREYEIHIIFSLFLIQRIFIELNLEKKTTNQLNQRKQWFKLQNGMYKLTSIRYVIIYLELCKLLKDPYLDPNRFLESLGQVGIFDHLQTIVNKTRKLRFIGAKPKDIIDNLELYTGSQMFNSKINLYQNVIGEAKGLFPVKLFLSRTIAAFKEKLQLGTELKQISQLLNVKEADFLTCWRFKPIDTKSLVYKIQMCLKAGIAQVDIFNNIGILNRINVEQCHLVTKSLCESGQPGSVFVFKALVNSIRLRTRQNKSNQSDWTDHDSEDILSNQQLKTLTAKTDHSATISKTTQSSKMWRMEVFKLVTHLLNLDRSTRMAMYKADINIDPTQLIDVTRNLEYLLSQNFTKDDIAQCPIVLAHPFDNVVRAQKDLVKLMAEPAMMVHSLSSSSSPSPLPLVDMATNQPLHDSPKDNSVPGTVITTNLLSDPVTHLNVLQYYMEKENNFSLHYAQTQSVVEFVN